MNKMQLSIANALTKFVDRTEISLKLSKYGENANTFNEENIEILLSFCKKDGEVGYLCFYITYTFHYIKKNYLVNMHIRLYKHSNMI